jgi:ABC-type multidrug transport system ATPase subunit
MIQALSLTKRYSGVPAVSEVNFRIEPHQILG